MVQLIFSQGIVAVENYHASDAEMNVLMKLFDTSQDGQIRPGEYWAALKIQNKNIQGFQACDANGDKILKKEEMKEVWILFWPNIAPFMQQKVCNKIWSKYCTS